MGWYSWSFKLTTTGITNKNRRGERMGPTLGQFLLNVPSNSALFPLPKFYSSSSPPLCQRSQKVQQQRYLGGHNTASCSIQFPLSLTHPFPIKDVWFSCVRVIWIVVGQETPSHCCELPTLSLSCLPEETAYSSCCHCLI